VQNLCVQVTLSSSDGVCSVYFEMGST